MHESERNRLKKLQTVLILAVRDMEQAIAAAARLHADDSDDDAYRRALETAIAVCYMRPFTPSMKLPAEYVPTTPHDRNLHDILKRLRNKAYAHTDPAAGRSASMRTTGEDGEIVRLQYREEWMALSVAELPSLIAFFGRQRERFLTDAARIHVDLEEDV